MRSNLEDVITSINLLRSTFKLIKNNYVWDLGYNLMGIPMVDGLLFPFNRFHLPQWISWVSMGILFTIIKILQESNEVGIASNASSHNSTRFDSRDTLHN